jgi:hypothetical protein
MSIINIFESNTNVLELFAGSRSIGNIADKLGMKVFSSDLENFEGIDYVVSILDFDVEKVPFVPDIFWSSPPCTGFSVAAIGKNWVKGEEFEPKTDSARLGIRLLEKTIEIKDYFLSINPNMKWYIENPRGKMRKSPSMQENEKIIRHTVTYCQYGDDRMKPTDIWTNNKDWIPKQMCSNGDTCHEAAHRGSKTGTQGKKGAYNRSMIPYKLCLEILKS